MLRQRLRLLTLTTCKVLRELPFKSIRFDSNQFRVSLQDFVNAVQQWFVLIDVKKNQRDTRKETKKGKELVLDLHNEIKIITSSEEVFSLWSEFISKYSQGNLVDPETCKKMKLNSRWIPQKDGILNR